MPTLISLVFAFFALPLHATPVAFVLTLGPTDPSQFTDGYPREDSHFPPYRRHLSVRTEATPDFRAGSLVRLRFSKPIGVGISRRHEISTVVLQHLDLRLSLADLAAFSIVHRASLGDVVVREKPRGWTVEHVLAHARASASLQELADDAAELPDVLALDRAEVNLGHLSFAVVSAGEVVDIDSSEIVAPRALRYDAEREVVITEMPAIHLGAGELAKLPVQPARDRKIARLFDVLSSVDQIRRRMSRPNVVRPNFGQRRDCTGDFFGKKD